MANLNFTSRLEGLRHPTMVPVYSLETYWTNTWPGHEHLAANHYLPGHTEAFVTSQMPQSLRSPRHMSSGDIFAVFHDEILSGFNRGPINHTIFPTLPSRTNKSFEVNNGLRGDCINLTADSSTNVRHPRSRFPQTDVKPGKSRDYRYNSFESGLNEENKPYEFEIRKPSWIRKRTARTDMTSNDNSSHDASSASRQWRFPPHHQQSVEKHNVEVLTESLEHHRNQVQAKRDELRMAAARPLVSSSDLLGLIMELQLHEDSQEKAQQDLNIVCEELENTQSKRNHDHSSFRSRDARQHRSRSSPTRKASVFQNSDDFFGDFFSSSPPSCFERLSPSTVFENFERLSRTPFVDFSRPGSGETIYEETRSSSHRKSKRKDWREYPGIRARHDRQVPPAKHENVQYMSHPITPPLTVLQPIEGKALFRQYNDQWQRLALSDSSVPFPARGLKVVALADHHTLWSPQTAEKPSAWSQDTIMQANVQAFFLCATGMTPQYTTSPTSGRIRCGFDRATASDEQIKALIELLKKEKIRWHSDRLGRRNDGRPGVNNALQRDERVRAVFHAVCELMEVAQGTGRL